MKKVSKVEELSDALSLRYGISRLDCGGWGGLELFGGVGMDPSTFDAIANAAIRRGDDKAVIYELESTKVEFAPILINLDFSSFNHLKGNLISHFEIAMLPLSRTWVALLTSEFQTIVYGNEGLLSDVALSISE